MKISFHYVNEWPCWEQWVLSALSVWYHYAGDPHTAAVYFAALLVLTGTRSTR